MDYQKINQLFYNELERDQFFNSYDSSYLFTTENISGYMPDLSGKRVLSVCSSGDHYFNALIKGAKQIDLFDINRLSFMVLKLKKAAIINLDREEFLSYFGILNKEHILDYNIYIKFSKYLDEETYTYFSHLYDWSCRSGNFLYSATSIFFADRSEPSTYFKCNHYLSRENYDILKSKLYKLNNIQFIWSDVMELKTKLVDLYDVIFLSNIQDYQKIEKYSLMALNLKKYLTENGKIYMSYLYHNTTNYYLVKELADKLGGYILDIDSVYSTPFNRVKDKVLVLSK